MTLNAVYNGKMVERTDDSGKLPWHSPTIARIEIKRTLAGVSGTNDGSVPSNPT